MHLLHGRCIFCMHRLFSKLRLSSAMPVRWLTGVSAFFTSLPRAQRWHGSRGSQRHGVKIGADSRRPVAFTAAYRAAAPPTPIHTMLMTRPAARRPKRHARFYRVNKTRSPVATPKNVEKWSIFASGGISLVCLYIRGRRRKGSPQQVGSWRRQYLLSSGGPTDSPHHTAFACFMGASSIRQFCDDTVHIHVTGNGFFFTHSWEQWPVVPVWPHCSYGLVFAACTANVTYFLQQILRFGNAYVSVAFVRFVASVATMYPIEIPFVGLGQRV